MNKQAMLDIYRDDLLSWFGPTTATGLARLLGGALSQDEITRLLASAVQSSVACRCLSRTGDRNING